MFAPKGGATGFNDPDDHIVIPLGTAQFQLLGTPYLRSINLLAPSDDRIDEAMAEAERIMRRAHRIPMGRPDEFQLRTQADFLNTAAETTQVFTYLLAGVAMVSLLVGGIGMMNIMLVSGTERTHEIGLRKAVGATRTSIVAQFLIEAIVLCASGGLLGIAIGAGAAVVMHAALGWTTDVAPSAILVAFTFSVVVGALFGVWPARRAAHPESDRRPAPRVRRLTGPCPAPTRPASSPRSAAATGPAHAPPPSARTPRRRAGPLRRGPTRACTCRPDHRRAARGGRGNGRRHPVDGPR